MFSLEVVKHDDKVTMTYPGGRTVVIAQSSDGVVFSPAWNDRHFTWTDNGADVPFPHVTNETTDDKIAKTQYGSEDAFYSDMYAGVIGIGEPKPINWVDGDHLWTLDTDAYGDRLEKHNVIERSEDRFWIGFKRLEALLRYLAANEDELKAFLEDIYDPIEFQAAAESEDRLFFTANLESFVLQRPDGYVMEFSMEHPINMFERIRSVRTFDVMAQLFEDPALSA